MKMYSLNKNRSVTVHDSLCTVVGLPCAAEVPAETVIGSLMGGGAFASTQFVEVPCG